MRFSFTEDQMALRQGAGEVLRDVCDLSDVRAIAESGDWASGRSDERWAALSELGAPGLVAPVEVGGLGLTDIELIGVIEEAGQVCLPEPLGVHAGVAVPILAQLDCAQALRDAVSGLGRVGVGGIEIDPDGPAVQRVGDTAVARGIEGATHASRFLLATATDDGLELHLVEAADVTVTATATLDRTRDLGQVTWEPRASTKVADGSDGASLIEEIASRLATYAAAELVGLTQTMMTMTASYVIDRRQFNRAVGEFQSVKHLLADVRIELEFARPALYRAAWALATDDEMLHHDAAVAKALASDLGVNAAATSLQLHGAIGYTWEHDLQLLMKRTWAVAASHGDAATQRARAWGLGF